MERSSETEILDGCDVPDQLVRRAYEDLTRVHRLLGDTAAVARAIRRDSLPVLRIMDIGCAHGGVLRDLKRRLDVEAIGVDLRPPSVSDKHLPIVCADATRDALPDADVAFCLYVVHHLSEADLVALIRNVGRYCRRFVLLDMVRHPLPRALFRAFVAPAMSQIAAADGRVSFRRAFTAAEMRRITVAALDGSGSRFIHSVSPFYIRQVIDITYSRT